MRKEWHEESAEALAGGFAVERQVYHLQATCENIGIEESGAPDGPTDFADVVVPADVIAVTQGHESNICLVMFALGVYLRMAGLSD